MDKNVIFFIFIVLILLFVYVPFKLRLRGTIVFFLGIVLVFLGYPKIGMVLQIFGFINLFGQFFPIVVSTMRATPYIGTVLNLPIIAPLIDKLAGSNKKRAPV